MLAAPGSSELRVVGPTWELRDLGTGSEGKGPVGGAIEGRDGRGSELADMVMGWRVCTSATAGGRGAGAAVVGPTGFVFAGGLCRCAHVRRGPPATRRGFARYAGRRVRRGQAGPWAREASAKAMQRRRVVAVEAGGGALADLGTSWARPRGQRLSASLRVRSAGSVLAWWGKRSGDEMDGRIPWDSWQVQVLVQGPDEGTTDR